LAHCEFRVATPEDIQEILRTVRQENVAELEMIGVGIDTSLNWSLRNSCEAYVALIDGDVVCAFGVVATHDPNMGTPWMVGTSVIDKHSIAFLRTSKQVVDKLLERWSILRNFADARNARGLRWLRFMKFDIDPNGVCLNGFKFHQFEKRRL